MPREPLEAKRERARQIFARLTAAYPDAHCELNYRNPFELLIATILSAQCTDRQVNLVTATLFQKLRSPADFAVIPLPDLEKAIQRIGLYRNKAKSIKSCCLTLVNQHGGELPKTMEELTALGGVGRKTANVVLGNAFQLNVGVVVDTHVARLSHRLAFTREIAPEKIEPALQKLFPRDDWAMLSHLLIWHGRRRCFARQPDCPECEVQSLCPVGRKWAAEARSQAARASSTAGPA